MSSVYNMFSKKEKPSALQQLITNRLWVLISLTVLIGAITFILWMKRKKEEDNQLSHLEIMKKELLDIEERMKQAVKCLEQYVSTLDSYEQLSSRKV